jgi:type I restriction enzyme S subunit
MVSKFKNIPVGWKVKLSSDVLFFQEGPGVRKWQFKEEGVKLLNGGNINNNTINLNSTKHYLSEDEAYNKYKHFLVDEGDLLIACSGITINTFYKKIAFIKSKDLPLCLNTSTMRFKSLAGIELRYFFYYLQTKYFTKQIQKLITGSAQLNFGPSHMGKIEILLPPIDQQKKIAAILDAADAYRQKTKALITKYEELTQSLFLDMFGSLKGDKISLSTICDINPKKSEISSVDRSTLVSFMPMANVSVQGQVSHIEERTIDGVWSGFTYFKENDVVFAKITPCMENGKGAIMRNLKNSIGFGTTEFHVLRPLKAHSTAEYLFHLTHSEHFRALAEVNMTGSAGQKRVPRDFFDKFKVVAPPLILQNQFAERVQAIEAQKAQAQASLVQAEDLFNSLLQKAFKGELS